MSSAINATFMFGSVLPVILQEYTLGGGIPLVMWILKANTNSKSLSFCKALETETFSFM